MSLEQGSSLQPNISSENIVPYAPLNPGEAFVLTPDSGTFYDSSGPGRKPFVERNGELPQGAILGLVEKMKLFFEISLPVRSEVIDKETNGTFVRKGSPIARINLMFNNPSVSNP